MTGSVEHSAAYAAVSVGDAAPWFKQRSTSNENYVFDTSAGRYVVLCFLASAADAASRAALAAVAANRTLFDDDSFAFFGVSMDPADEAESRLRENLPGIRFFWDFDGRIGRAYGVVPRDTAEGAEVAARRFWLVLDPTLRVMARFAFGAEHHEGLFAYLRSLPPPARFAGFEVPPPILVLPNVFEPGLCQALIDTYEREGGEDSGFMREVNGKTVKVEDHRHKRRRDCEITEPALVKAIQNRILRRVAPEIKKIYAFDATRMERYIVGCYAAEDNAHFRPHRDNTTKGTAHRRFAVSINLNSEFEGGEVGFPEYGPRSYKAPPGGAVVFPCAVLHAVSQVTQGRRYAFLPFLYDEAAAKLREQNNQFLEGGSYKAAASA